jgi:hypothetical protein
MIAKVSSSQVTVAIELALGLLIALLVTRAIYDRFLHPLRKFNGPALASITSLWYWRSVRFAIAQNYQKPLHDKYGAFVRIAPDTIAISDATAISTIYGPKRKNEPVFEKAEFCKSYVLSRVSTWPQVQRK